VPGFLFHGRSPAAAGLGELLSSMVTLRAAR
jgi:hypothetical protein